MIHRMFSVFDTAVNAYALPFSAANDQAATRIFSLSVNDKKSDSLLCSHPEHFQLFFVGSFDDQSGLYLPLKSPTFVVSAVSLSDPKIDNQSHSEVIDRIDSQLATIVSYLSKGD